MFKKILTILIILILLALDWAALHDILKGQEPDYLMEYSMLIFSLLVFILMIINYKKIKQQNFHTK